MTQDAPGSIWPNPTTIGKFLASWHFTSQLVLVWRKRFQLMEIHSNLFGRQCTLRKLTRKLNMEPWKMKNPFGNWGGCSTYGLTLEGLGQYTIAWKWPRFFFLPCVVPSTANRYRYIQVCIMYIYMYTYPGSPRLFWRKVPWIFWFQALTWNPYGCQLGIWG